MIIFLILVIGCAKSNDVVSYCSKMQWGQLSTEDQLLKAVAKKSKAQLEKPDDQGRIAAHYAAEHSWMDVIRVLSEQEVAMNIPDKQHITPLELTAQNWNVDMMEMIWESGPQQLRAKDEGISFYFDLIKNIAKRDARSENDKEKDDFFTIALPYIPADKLAQIKKFISSKGTDYMKREGAKL